MSRSLSNYDKYLKFNKDSNFKLGGNPNVWVKDAERGYVKGEVTEKNGQELKLKMGGECGRRDAWAAAHVRFSRIVCRRRCPEDHCGEGDAARQPGQVRRREGLRRAVASE